MSILLRPASAAELPAKFESVLEIPEWRASLEEQGADALLLYLYR